MDKKQQLKQLLIGLGETYDKVITPSLFMIYEEALKDISIEIIKSACSKHLLDPKHGTFFPKPADIVRNIAGQTISTEDKGIVAWLEIMRQIRVIGAYGSLELDDKQALMAVKGMGSWQSLCHTDLDKMTWKQKEFLANYKSLENTPIEMLPQKLEGIEDLHNQRVGRSSIAGLIDEDKLKLTKGE